MSSGYSSAAGPAATPVCRTGSQVVVDALLAHGVDTVFGYIGASVLPLFDRLHTAPIRFVVPCHEQGGCHMADAYARASGKTGVVIATSGPGACNLVTGLTAAMMDSVPLVAITGQVRTDLIGGDAFQEAPMVGITRPVKKHNHIVRDVKDPARTIRQAFRIASTGRPGPVLIDLPMDVEFATCESNWPSQIARAVEAIEHAQRPVLLAGGGVVSGNATAELRQLARKANLPVAMTLMGLGSYAQTLPESLDMPGMHGTAYANYAVQECDLLIAVGVRFDDRVAGDVRSFARRARVIHIDIDPASISKLVRVDIPIVGDAKTVLSGLARHVRFRERAAWFAQIAAWKDAWTPDFDRAASVKPQYVIEELCRRTGGEAIITTGVGQHQMWAAQFYRFRRSRQLITSGGRRDGDHRGRQSRRRDRDRSDAGREKPCVVDFHVAAHENVWPMVPAGRGLHEMEGLPLPAGAM